MLPWSTWPGSYSAQFRGLGSIGPGGMAGVVVQIRSPEERQRTLVGVLRALSGQPDEFGWQEVLKRLGAVADNFGRIGSEGPSLGVAGPGSPRVRALRAGQQTLNMAATWPSDSGPRRTSACPVGPGRVRSSSRTGLPELGSGLLCAGILGVSGRDPDRFRDPLLPWPWCRRRQGYRERSWNSSDFGQRGSRPDLRLRANLLSALAQELARLGESWARNLQDQALGQPGRWNPGLPSPSPWHPWPSRNCPGGCGPGDPGDPGS